ncbi:hypothetical protein MKX01_014170 [Papaver californicum]|nr:hypothetical protein MKX01_014170 [Papaver californicum]
MEGSNRENMQADEHQDSFTSQDHPEESGWTFYLDDDEFFPRNSRDNRVQPSSSSCYDDTPSMISDADSLAPWNNNKFMDSTTFKKLGLLNPKKNKKKSNSGTDDPDMEDTASSPVNSPKVSSMKQHHRQMNSPRQNQDDDDDDIDIEYSTSQQRRKGSMSGDHQHF